MSGRRAQGGRWRWRPRGGVPLRLPLASVGERAAAFIADLGILAAIYVGLSWMLEDVVDASQALLLLVAFVIRHGYFFLFELSVAGGDARASAWWASGCSVATGACRRRASWHATS